MRKTVESVGYDALQVHQDRVGGQNYIALLRAPGGEVTEGEQQAQGAHKYITVRRKQFHQSAAVQQSVTVVTGQCIPDLVTQQVNAGEHGQVLGDHRSQRHALHAPVESEHEQQVQQHVADVQDQLQYKCGAGIVEADEDAGKRIYAKHGGSAPDTNDGISGGEFLDLGAAFDEVKR